MGILYLDACRDEDHAEWSVPIETLVVLHAIKCLDLLNGPCQIDIVLVESPLERLQPTLPVDWELFPSITFGLEGNSSVRYEAKVCKLPVYVSKENNLLKIVAGLSSVLRRLLAVKIQDHPLLGFRQSCLIACAEVSVWTRFCEVDVIESVKHFLSNPDFNLSLIPVSVARLEEHLSRAPRLHNVRKHQQAYAKSIGSSESEEQVPHLYAEGPSMTLADVVLFPCFFILLSSFPPDILDDSVPLVSAWYRRVMESNLLQGGIAILQNLTCILPAHTIQNGSYTLPSVPKESLYKSDPSRYKPRSNKMFTHQEDMEASLAIVDGLTANHEVVQVMMPFGFEQNFDWKSIPYDMQPEGGHVPEKRQMRKAEQLENMAKAVMKLAQPGQILVDFCSGSGHLGILLAWILPLCTVLLLENKDKSLHRAAGRVEKLGLKNVILVQGNIDYFRGKFDIGIALHACGVASDLVLQLCESSRAAFVVCPCCYGSIQSGHSVTFPRSKLFRNSSLSGKDYLVLGHCADQTHGEDGHKTPQGNLCMAAIDTDRLLHSQDEGYIVHLSKMKPQTCSPKNNLLVGIPREKTKAFQVERTLQV